MRHYLRKIAWVGVGLFVFLLFGAIWIHGESRHVPEFYRQATSQAGANVTAERLEKKRQLVENLLKMKEEALRQGVWKTTLTSDEINAWLADELPKKFPHLSRRGLSDPRVAIEGKDFLAAAKLTRPGFEFVLSCVLRVELTNRPNTLAIHLEDFKVGALSLPWSQIKERIAKEAAGVQLDLQWDEVEGNPVALIKLPNEYPDFPVKPVVVESIELDSSIQLSGRSGRMVRYRYEPKSSVYQITELNPSESSSRQATLTSGKERSEMTR